MGSTRNTYVLETNDVSVAWKPLEYRTLDEYATLLKR
jgi:hypothetical protein